MKDPDYYVKSGNNIRMVTHQGFVWNAVLIEGTLYFLRKLGRAGDCVCP